MKKYILIATAVLFYVSSDAREVIDGSSSNQKGNKTTTVDCARSTSTAELDINNVRAFILNGGDMWWDQPGTQNARYEIPKLDDPDQIKKNSLFAGSVWIGGVDANTNQVMVTAQTYRQSHYAYWPGPIEADLGSDTSNTTPLSIPSIAPEECSFWNKHFKIDKSVIDQFKDDFKNGNISTIDDVPEEIRDWPGKNNPWIDKLEGGAYTVNFNRDLAPFVDVSGPENEPDGDYNPVHGDYPDILGDQTIWWVMNDVGNQKEFGGNQEPLGGINGGEIGLELETRAFAFQTNDAVNDMTFYEQILKNKGNRTLNNTYLGQWVDPDLGNYVDDYVGCDVARGLGICYNGDDEDDGVLGYGLNPPALGVDFFEGPNADLNDGVDNDRDGLIDEGTDGLDNNGNGEVDEPLEREKIVMSNFLYYNNNSDPVNGNPQNKQVFYNYLQNIWGTGDYVMYDGGDGTDQSATYRADFMFPGTTDQEVGWGVGGSPENPIETDPWDEVSAGNNPADRRFLQSAGPFTLEPGAVNTVTIGVVWCRAGSGGATGSLACLKAADDLAQELFDRNFEDLNGPNPPHVEVTELDQEVILTLIPSTFIVNDVEMNTESYAERDPGLDGLAEDPFYRFQGYLIYQLQDETVSSGDLTNIDKARLIAQCDLEDGVSSLVNYENEGLGDIPVEMVQGEDKGLFHTLSIKTDAFNSGKPIVNNKEYYYMVIAYADNVDPYVVDNKKDQFLGSKKGIERVVAIPSKVGLTDGGVILNAEYGQELDITSISGNGTGGHVIEYTDETYAELLENDSVATPTYPAGNSPITAKIFDPFSVKGGDFKVKLYSRLIFDLNRSDEFQIGDTIKAINNRVRNPDFHDWDADSAIGYIYAFVDTFATVIDSVVYDTLPEINNEIRFNEGTRDTVTVIKEADTVYIKQDTTITQTGLAIDSSVTPPDTVPVYDTTIVEADTLYFDADTVVTTFNIDTFSQVEQILERIVKLNRTVVEAKVVVKNNNFYNKDGSLFGPKGTFSKHFTDSKTILDASNPNNPQLVDIFQGYSSLPLNFKSDDGRFGRTYDFQLYEYFEIEDENGNILNPGEIYRVSEFDEAVLRGADGESYGLTVQMKHGLDPEFEKYELTGNAFHEATIELTDGVDWLTTVDRPDDPDALYFADGAPTSLEVNTIDPAGVYTRVLNGALAPYIKCKKAAINTGFNSTGGPKYPGSTSKFGIENLPNIDIVIDYDNPENWTKAVVLQADLIDTSGSITPSGKAKYIYNKSRVPSVGKDGQPSGESVAGLGWFPGYVIDLDRGVKLSVMFSESQMADKENGNNLIWEPTTDDDGGKSYVYVMGESYSEAKVTAFGTKIDSIEEAYGDISLLFGLNYKKIFEDVSWVLSLKKTSNDVSHLSGSYKIRARLDHYYRSNKPNSYIPEYQFNASEFVPTQGDDAYLDSLCDDFRIVPNPYYAYSEYENGQLDNRVRLTNLPNKCRITIMTLSGTIVKYFDKDDNSNFLDWNLRNEAGAKVASGSYLIHIVADAEDGGCERVVKFFGVMRPLDLDTF